MNSERIGTEAIGIIVTHGRLAEELLRTVELIIGKLDYLYPISGSDLCNEDLIGDIKAIIRNAPGKNVVLFVDHFGGSCCANSVRAVKGMEGVKVISGVNLPLLLDFATKRGSMGFEEMVDHLIRRGRESVKVIDI
ncbi:MAG: PTS fructose transporter subunit IIA [Candidatus Krumholzibacteria bacterium]|nr:PTS fructose transporter subunit IIA [Candidatus Krumholzibacteria bacterium]